MYLFNEAIDTLELIELPMHGCHFTWTNKQLSPLLKRLDLFFTYNAWTEKYPNTTVRSMTMKTSYRWPCIIEINTKILKGHIFRFENHWLDRDDFTTKVV